MCKWKSFRDEKSALEREIKWSLLRELRVNEIISNWYYLYYKLRHGKVSYRVTKPKTLLKIIRLKRAMA